MRIPLLLLAMLISVSAAASANRSSGAVREFKRQQPCPSTGKARGRCPGWQVDHIAPLKCGGPDTPANMQWLTIGDHKAKTKREARMCRYGARPIAQP